MNKYLVMYIRRNGLDRTRFGFSVSKKVGKAVLRNRVRRRLKELCRKHLPELESGYDVVVIARPAAQKVPYAKLRGALRHLFHSSGMFVEKEVESDGR